MKEKQPNIILIVINTLYLHRKIYINIQNHLHYEDETNNSRFNKSLLKCTACVFLATGAATLPVNAVGLSTTPSSMMQQKDFAVSGVVKDVKGEPLIGVTVMEHGTANGTITDVNGHYTLNVKSGKANLDFSYVGYRTQSIALADRNNIPVKMVEENAALDELVVIGYGTQKKADVTSAVASVKEDDFNKGAVLDAGQLVQGKVAGLQISLPTGDPTANTSVMLRGNSTLMGTTDPLILVDGVPGNFTTVAPEEIESIDVLKDGSATAIYGTRGTNGVIIITTKNARANQPTTIDYNGYMSISHQVKRPDFMKASDLRQRWDEDYYFSGANDEDYGADTDWLDEISRVAVSHSHNVTLKGGGKTTSMLANLNYSDREGVFKESDSRNIRGRIEVTHRMFDNKLKTNLALMANERNSNQGFGGYIYRNACIQNPTQPIYDADGNYVERNVYFYDNPVSRLNESESMNRRRNMRFTGTVEYKPYDDLTLKGMYTRKGQSSLTGYYETRKHPSTTENGLNGYASRSTSDYISDMVELTADWHKAIGKHRLGAVAGYNYEKNTTELFSASNKNFPNDSYSYNNYPSSG